MLFIEQKHWNFLYVSLITSTKSGMWLKEAKHPNIACFHLNLLIRIIPFRLPTSLWSVCRFHSKFEKLVTYTVEVGLGNKQLHTHIRNFRIYQSIPKIFFSRFSITKSSIFSNVALLFFGGRGQGLCFLRRQEGPRKFGSFCQKFAWQCSNLKLRLHCRRSALAFTLAIELERSPTIRKRKNGHTIGDRVGVGARRLASLASSVFWRAIAND